MPYSKGAVRATMPTDSQERKDTPLATGVLDYFPNALAAVARVSERGNRQHNPGQPLHWSRGKSTDHADTIMRHLADRGLRDSDGIRHSAKVAWRALALLEEELEAAGAAPGRASWFEQEPDMVTQTVVGTMPGVEHVEAEVMPAPPRAVTRLRVGEIELPGWEVD